MVLKKFLLITRGRTGSTAVIDELGKTMNILTTQELFLLPPFSDQFIADSYKLIPPFDIWKSNTIWWKRAIFTFCNDQLKANNYLNEVESLTRDKEFFAIGWKLLSHHFDQRPYLAGLIKNTITELSTFDEIRQDKFCLG
jgi:hypothetical protein